jgi:hypothetical protein
MCDSRFLGRNRFRLQYTRTSWVRSELLQKYFISRRSETFNTQLLAVSGPPTSVNNFRHRKQCVTYVSWLEIASVFITLGGYGPNYCKHILFPDVVRLLIHRF